jgi:hypothetical protein
MQVNAMGFEQWHVLVKPEGAQPRCERIHGQTLVTTATCLPGQGVKVKRN